MITGRYMINMNIYTHTHIHNIIVKSTFNRYNDAFDQFLPLLLELSINSYYYIL